MTKTYRPDQPEQDLLLPPSLRDWLPEDHRAYFVSDRVDPGDLSAIYAVYEKEARGQPPYDPRLMTKLLVYGYCVGVCSARKMEQRVVEDVAFRVLAAGNAPDFRTMADFRKIHRKALEGFFEQVLRMVPPCGMGAVQVGRVAWDGSKVKANAGKHKAMSWGRVQEQEKAIRKQVKELLARAAETDAEEDRRYGRDRRGDELPEELPRRERIREAKKAWQERAREEAKAEGKPGEEAQPEAKDQYNFTDPESRIMKSSSEGFVQGYNAQMAVEPEWQLMVGQAVTQEANDQEPGEPMVEAIEAQWGQRPKELLADNGYCSEKNREYLESAKKPQKKIEAYLATGRQKHGERRIGPRGPLPQRATRVERMKRKLQTKAGAAIYAARKAIVEPVFGQSKQVRGFRRFSLRGLAKGKAEWAWVSLTHNILKLHRLCYG